VKGSYRIIPRGDNDVAVLTDNTLLALEAKARKAFGKAKRLFGKVSTINSPELSIAPHFLSTSTVARSSQKTACVIKDRVDDKFAFRVNKTGLVALCAPSLTDKNGK